MTKRDLKFIIILLVIAAFALGGWYVYYLNSQKDHALCDVYYKSNIVHTMDFSKDEIYEIDGDYGHMIIEMKDGQVRVQDVECPNLICEYMGWVKQGEFVTIYCVPNDIIIRERHAS